MLYEREHRNSRPNHWCLSLSKKKKSTSKLISETKGRKMKKIQKKKIQENRGYPKRFWRQINQEILGKN